MSLYILIAIASAAIVLGAIGWVFFFRSRRVTLANENAIETQLLERLELLERAQERDARLVREEFSRNREEAGVAAKAQRDELSCTLKNVSDSTFKSLGEISSILRGQLEQVVNQSGKLADKVDLRLKELQQDNAQQIDKMRATVDEKLQGTLEKRLGESFQMVSERLERVHQGLGAMQQLASDVGGLQRVLTNVKARGGWGEVQLGALLEEVLAPEQFERNVRTREGSGENVEFAIRLPGGENGTPVWLPIDAKFPVEDYQRLTIAQEGADPIATEQAMKNLETALRKSARDICAKYINPPRTTNFALMFLPTEGLYAEAIRRIGLVEQVQRECKVIFAGPTTLAALLNSLQMGFRTLAIQKSSSEVWSLLSSVRTEFGKFGALLDGVKRKLEQASNQIDDVARKSRTIEKRLNHVEELPSHPEPLLPDFLPNEEDEDLAGHV
ncbi:MAG: DNA recombination protein RmuC [Verrucomicrobiota bacterium]|nr:DNA recombination protein RmuC [Chthoniobacterales bacterium]MDQ3414749.1 DNA recombination protein RmuC [Verrucomicrobiota bacterium]